VYIAALKIAPAGELPIWVAHVRLLLLQSELAKVRDVGNIDAGVKTD